MNEIFPIRYAKRDDIPNIAAFLHVCWREEYRQIIVDDYLDTMSVDERNDGLLERYNKGVTDCLMMQDGNRLIGVAAFGKSFTTGFADDGEISAIYLHHDYIGKGYGHQLFVKAEQRLDGKGYTHFVLDLLPGNTRAKRFYLSHGYEKVADRSIRLGKNYYQLDVMRKRNPFAIR